MPVLAPPPNTILDEFPPPKILDVEIPLTPAVVGASALDFPPKTSMLSSILPSSVSVTFSSSGFFLTLTACDGTGKVFLVCAGTNEDAFGSSMGCEVG